MAMRIDIKRMLKKYGLRPKKSWSQNFLVDVEVIRELVEAIGVKSEQSVVELGAGLGVITEELRHRAKTVIAVERDRDLARILRVQFSEDPRVKIMEANAAKLNWEEILKPLEPFPMVVGNLPYHMATPILFGLLASPQRFSQWVIMLQKEMAERLISDPGSRTYGVTSILVQQHMDLEWIMEVGPDAYYPAPKVRSAVLRFVPRKEPRVRVLDFKMFERVVKGAFQQRRKILKNSMMAVFKRNLGTEFVNRAFEQAQIDGSLRPEQFSAEEFGRLSDALWNLEKNSG